MDAFCYGKPIYKWMITRGTPVTQETSIWLSPVIVSQHWARFLAVDTIADRGSIPLVFEDGIPKLVVQALKSYYPDMGLFVNVGTPQNAHVCFLIFLVDKDKPGDFGAPYFQTNSYGGFLSHGGTRVPLLIIHFSKIFYYKPTIIWDSPWLWKSPYGSFDGLFPWLLRPEERPGSVGVRWVQA